MISILCCDSLGLRSMWIFPQKEEEIQKCIGTGDHKKCKETCIDIQHVALLFLLFIFMQLEVADAQTAGLYCAKGDTNCGNFNGVGYFTSGGGECDGDPFFVAEPEAPGLNYSKYWCGSYYIGAVDAQWNTLEPV